MAELLDGQLVRSGVLAPGGGDRRNAAELGGALPRAVQGGARPPVLVADGLDEARGEMLTITADLLVCLASYASLVVSTRPVTRAELPTLLIEALEADAVLRPDIAFAALEVAEVLATWGRRVEAVAPTEEAAALRRDLAAENPAYTPNLAMALTNLGSATARWGGGRMRYGSRFWASTTRSRARRCCFTERLLDQATESLPRITRKCRSCLDFPTHEGLGPDEVPPRILFTVPDVARSNAIQK
jgi:hypothetical protein